MILDRTLAILVLLTASCFAADVDGKWTGAMSTPNGDVPVTFAFKTDGAALTGSTSGPDGSEITIANGKADGNNIFVHCHLRFRRHAPDDQLQGRSGARRPKPQPLGLDELRFVRRV